MKILKYNEHNHTDLEVGGLKCDNPECDYSDMSIPFEEYEVGKPCPKCGESLLSQEDYDQILQMKQAVEILNNYSQEDIDKMVANLSSDEIDSVLDLMNTLKIKKRDNDESGREVWSIGEKKKEDTSIGGFDAKSLEPTKDDLVGFVSDYKEVKDKEIKKIKKEIEVTTPGLKKSIKKFEDFSITIEMGDNGSDDEVFDPSNIVMGAINTNDVESCDDECCSNCDCNPCECSDEGCCNGCSCNPCECEEESGNVIPFGQFN